MGNLEHNPAKSRAKKVWIDLDNTPHVPFFEPIIEELEQRGYSVVLTARDAFQVCELADQKGMPYQKIGRHHGKHRIIKGLGLVYRALQLIPFIIRQRPLLGLSHGARSQIMACNIFRIPTVLIVDYEFAKCLPLMYPKWEIVPDVIPDDALYCGKDRVRKYPGIKENVYVTKFKPDPSILSQLHLNGEDMVITVRPPATEAHYHNPESEVLFEHFMRRMHTLQQAKIVLLPRNKKQGDWILQHYPEWFRESRVIIPDKAVDGLNLLWHSDLAVSGGGTMNREAAALGVPVYSIFRGKIGAVDLALQKEGRLMLIETTAEVDQKIALKRRDKTAVSFAQAQQTLQTITNHIEEIMRSHYPGLY